MGTDFQYLHIRGAHGHLGHRLHIIIIIIVLELHIFGPGIIHGQDKKIEYSRYCLLYTSDAADD